MYVHEAWLATGFRFDEAGHNVGAADESASALVQQRAGWASRSRYQRTCSSVHQPLPPTPLSIHQVAAPPPPMIVLLKIGFDMWMSSRSSDLSKLLPSSTVPLDFNIFK